MRNISYTFLPPGIVPSVKKFENIDKPVETSDMDRLLSLVYATDPRTGLASSDLSILASDSVPAEIADFVRKNLMQPVADVQSSIINGEQVDDDTLFALTRNINESSRDYVDRVDNYLRSINQKSGE